jgi:hypothetical protein
MSFAKIDILESTKLYQISDLRNTQCSRIVCINVWIWNGAAVAELEDLRVLRLTNDGGYQKVRIGSM